jgi:SAM-dependent methyltransferase
MPQGRLDLHEANRRSWNAATLAHNSHKDGQAQFLRKGGSTLFPEESALLGDVRGDCVLHLLCNSGPDTLSIAARGARVTGVDISDEAIRYARQLSQDAGIPADFLRTDVYEFLATALASTWDVVFMSYGAYIWLSDLDAFFQDVARVLAPGGRLLITEFHPLVQMLDDSWNLLEPCSTGGREVVSTDGVSDYVADSGNGLVPWGASPGLERFSNPHPSYEFNWSIGDILSRVLGTGLRLEHYQEYPYSNGCRLLPDMVETEGRRFVPPRDRPSLPLMFSLVARRPAG